MRDKTRSDVLKATPKDENLHLQATCLRVCLLLPHGTLQNARRREELEGARDTVAGERSKTLGHVLPDSLRNCALRFDRVGFELVVERHIKCETINPEP